MKMYEGKLKVGDLVSRRIKSSIDKDLADKTGHLGLVVSKQMSGNPTHPCVDVWWMKSGKTYSIAERLLEVKCYQKAT